VNAPFLGGLAGAWSVGLVAVGIFFCLAYALRRREAEYLLFGLLAVMFAVTTAGVSLAYLAADLPAWREASMVAHVGSTLAVALHLHFVMRYTEARHTRAGALVAYPVAVVFATLRATDWWWVPGSVHAQAQDILGYVVAHVSATPLPHAYAYYALALTAQIACLVLLLRAYRSGQREALLALVGCASVVVAGASDAALASGLQHRLPYVLPHAFLLYAFALSSTLLLRYRRATGQLERTVSSLRERTAELRLSHRELSLMETEIQKQQQLAAVGELAASIAHEVRNPLAVIVNATASLRHGRIGAGDRETLLGIVDEEAARLNLLVTDLLRFARPLSVARAEVDLPELVARVVAFLGDEYQFETSFDESTGADRVLADATLLQLALENLIQNACQAMPDGGTIRVSSEASTLAGSACVRLEVADDGSGMTADVVQRAFDPFFTTRPRGNGLGLPIVQRITHAHHGEVIINSNPGAGTRVALLIPRGAPPSQANDASPDGGPSE
jgi:signal transduction histidine kinase